MVRRSLLVAVLAGVMSLLLHGLGLSITSGGAPAPSGQENPVDVADVGSAFEDFTEELAEPAVPEPAQTPDTPEALPAETPPTSQALVASDTPQDVTTPDTALVEAIEPDSAEPGGGDDDTVADPAPTETTDTAVSEVSPDPIPSETDEQAPDQTDAEAVAALEPDIVIAALPDEPDILPADETDPAEASAVTRSLRPPTERPSTEALRAQEPAQQPSAATGVIESPLTAYKRSGVDLLRGGGSGAGGFSGSRGVGNASATNYAGQVLSRLNRAPVVYASARGRARVSFLINADGSLGWIRVLSSSGNSDIENAARAQVRSAAPFPKPPGGTSQRFVFNYRNR